MMKDESISTQSNGFGNDSCVDKDKPELTDEEVEAIHFRKIANAFLSYQIHSTRKIQREETYINKLPPHHQELLENYRIHLGKLKTGIEHNYEIIKLIAKGLDSIFTNKAETFTRMKRNILPSAADMEKVQQTIKQLVRDWSKEGQGERDQCYLPILKAIDTYFPQDEVNPSSIKILVPGAGLGRLAFEIAKRGYLSQGNEFSLFMLFTSNFVLNRCHEPNMYRVYPWIHNFINNLESEDQLRQIEFPDVNPSDLPPNSQFSMTAGDFLEVYREEGEWDCIATCFFIDCAHNIISYIETIWKILKPGGKWINLGPLLYHFDEIPNEDSIEPSYQIVKDIIQKLGFKMLEEKLRVPTTYSYNSLSLLKHEYDSIYFVCEKPL